MTIEYPSPDKQPHFDDWWNRLTPLLQEGVSNGFIINCCSTHDQYTTDDETALFWDGEDPCVPIIRVLNPRLANDAKAWLDDLNQDDADASHRNADAQSSLPTLPNADAPATHTPNTPHEHHTPHTPATPQQDDAQP